ncbi:MAG: Gfo/Idh/MocA family oxidoreductase, partial [Verrucomicrobia bacterium]|nr:Gfo/Idh/MocA family oxidoreductase [Verrucomicrobiota bacterium]
MNKSSLHSGISRRRFLAAAGLAIAAPNFIPASALGRQGQTAPSSRIVMGVVGWGMMGPGNTDAFLSFNDCQVVAACDLDQDHLKQAVDRINDQYKNKDCKTYHDYREMMARKDIDAVMIAVPDHWHALLSVEAANNKKDIYGEKPLARTIAEQQAMVKAVQQNKRIWQTGSWQRSQAPFRKAAEIVRNGLIGKVTRVEVGLPDGVHMNWRWNYNTGGGQLLDWIGHHCDIAHWGLGFDNAGPSEIEGHGDFPPADAVWNTCTKYRITLK